MAEELSAESLEEQVVHLLVALEHRTVVGQATGMVMERFKLKPDEAFSVLRRLSSERHMKLYDVACEIVANGRIDGVQLPGATETAGGSQ